MKHTVTWVPSADAALIAIWLDAADRIAVTHAVAAIERALARDPEQAGEARSGKRRILVELPLAVIFEVHSADRLVRVLQVKYVSP